LLAVIEFNENPNKIEYFEEIKKFGLTNGLLYSNFSKNKTSYLITSLWSNQDGYLNKKFEKIASNYNKPLNTKIIELVASWKLIKKHIKLFSLPTHSQICLQHIVIFLYFSLSNLFHFK
jgi:hypothetical protein